MRFWLVFLLAAGCDDGGDDPPHPSELDLCLYFECDAPGVAPSPGRCCRVCNSAIAQPCGDQCIELDRICSQDRGCACAAVAPN